MLGLVILVSNLFLTQGLTPTDLDMGVHCKLANDEADRVLSISNRNIKSDGRDEIFVDYYGFARRINLYAFGWELPVSVFLTVSNGTLSGMDTMKRSGDVAVCSSPGGVALGGSYEYGPELGFKYDFAKARFLYWEIEGKLLLKPTVRMQVVVSNTTGCRTEKIRFEDRPQNQYHFMTGKTWKSMLVSKLLLWGLRTKEQLPIMTQVVLWAHGTVFKYFTDAWCQE